MVQRRNHRYPARAVIFADDSPEVVRSKMYINLIIKLRKKATRASFR